MAFLYSLVSDKVECQSKVNYLWNDDSLFPECSKHEGSMEAALELLPLPSGNTTSLSLLSRLSDPESDEPSSIQP